MRGTFGHWHPLHRRGTESTEKDPFDFHPGTGWVTATAFLRTHKAYVKNCQELRVLCDSVVNTHFMILAPQ